MQSTIPLKQEVDKKDFCSIMNMPCLSEPAYYKQVETILEALKDEAEDDMRAAGQRVRAHNLKENAQLSSDAILDVAGSLGVELT